MIKIHLKNHARIGTGAVIKFLDSHNLDYDVHTLCTSEIDNKSEKCGGTISASLNQI